MNHLRTLFICSSIAICFFFDAHVVRAASLVRDLSVGSVGQDVLELQRFLNTDSETIVAREGVGSVGNETTYFGAATQNAVVRFQAKYPDETYRKAELSAPNGYVGLFTREAINRRMGNSVAGVQSSTDGGFVYDPEASALPPIPVPKYGDPLYTTADKVQDAYEKDIAATLARGRISAINALMRATATSSPTATATTSISTTSPIATTTTSSTARTGFVLATTTARSVATSSPMVTFIGPKTAQIGDDVAVFGQYIPSDLKIQIGSEVVGIKKINTEKSQAYFTVPRVEYGVYTLVFSSKSEAQDLVVPFNEQLSVVDKIVAPRVSKTPKVFVGGKTVTITGSRFDAKGETYLNGAFGLLKAVSSSDKKAVFDLPLLKDRFKNGNQIPVHLISEKVMPYVISTPRGQTMFMAATLLQ